MPRAALSTSPGGGTLDKARPKSAPGALGPHCSGSKSPTVFFFFFASRRRPAAAAVLSTVEANAKCLNCVRDCSHGGTMPGSSRPNSAVVGGGGVDALAGVGRQLSERKDPEPRDMQRLASGLVEGALVDVAVVVHRVDLVLAQV